MTAFATCPGDDPTPCLRGIVERLATPAGRLVGTPGHDRARAYLLERLEELALEPYAGGGFAQPYRVDDLDFTNLLAVAPGRDRKAPPVLIGAHYDAISNTPGADDNASAVAVALRVAERLKETPAGRDVVIALFDAEEPPFFHSSAMGSTHFYLHQRRGPVHAALVLDLVGHDVPLPGLHDLLFITGMESDPALERLLDEVPEPDGVRALTVLNRYVGDMSDHHAFRQGRTPYLFLTCGRGQHYHLPSDTPEHLNYAKLAAIARYTEDLVRDVSERDLAGPWEGYDPTPSDLRRLRRVLGPLALLLGREPSSREEIDALVALLKRRFTL